VFSHSGPIACHGNVTKGRFQGSGPGVLRRIGTIYTYTSRLSYKLCYSRAWIVIISDVVNSVVDRHM